MLQSHAKTLKKCNVTITRKNLKKRNWQPAFYSVYCLWGIIFSERSHALWKCFPAPCRCSLNGLFCSLPPLDLFFKNWKAAMTQPPPNLLRKTDNYLQFHFWAPQKRKTAFSAVFLFFDPPQRLRSYHCIFTPHKQSRKIRRTARCKKYGLLYRKARVQTRHAQMRENVYSCRPLYYNTPIYIHLSSAFILIHLSDTQF